MSKLEERYVVECRTNMAHAISDLFKTGQEAGFDNYSILDDIADAIYDEANVKVTITEDD